MPVNPEAFSSEELKIIRYYLTPRQPTWDYWFSHAIYLVLPFGLLFYGIFVSDVLHMALGTVALLIYLLYLIHAGAHYNRMFHTIIPTYERLLEASQMSPAKSAAARSDA